MADHVEVTKGKWRYAPNKAVLTEISKKIPELHGVSLSAFLAYLDAIGWNEDVKYCVRQGEPYKATPAGRRNNIDDVRKRCRRAGWISTL